MENSSSGVLFLLSAAVGVAMIGLGIIWPIIPVYAVELGAGGFLLAWIAMGIMLTGAKIVSWTTSDREAILKILNHVFGVVAIKRGRLYGDQKS